MASELDLVRASGETIARFNFAKSMTARLSKLSTDEYGELYRDTHAYMEDLKNCILADPYFLAGTEEEVELYAQLRIENMPRYRASLVLPKDLNTLTDYAQSLKLEFKVFDL